MRATTVGYGYHTKKEASMRLYTRQHVYYCGIDLHARSLYLCILDQEDRTAKFPVGSFPPALPFVSE